MKKYLIILFSIIAPSIAFSQVTDDFTDGNFTANPVWSGEDADFSVTSQELQLDNTVADDSHLMTASTAIDNATWEFVFRWEGFSSTGLSSSNEVFFYLVANQNVAPETTDISGYFVRIGNTSDEVSLYRQNTDISSSGVIEIIDGSANGFGSVTDASSGSIRVRVTRNAVGLWTLFADVSGGSTFVEVGTSTDATYTSSSFTGIFIDYSAGNSDGYFFDDISISTAATAIAVSSVSLESNTSLRVKFNQNVEQTSAELSSNYSIDNSISVTSAVRDGTNLDEVVLTVSTLATNDYQLTTSNVKDAASSTPFAAPEVKNFSYKQLALQSLVTNSANELKLTFNDNVDQTTAENTANYSIDNSIGTPSSAVMNSGDNSIVTLTLGTNLQALTNYTLTYGTIKNSSKNSQVTAGATQAFSYVIPLVVNTITVLSKTQVLLTFNLSLDKTTSETITNYSIDKSIGNPTSVVQNTTEFNKVTLTLGADLTENTYTITMNNVADAASNALAAGSTKTFDYLPMAITSVAIVNSEEIEITFNQNVDQTTSETVGNYTINGEVGTPATAVRNTGNSAKVNFTFTNALVNNNYTVTVNAVENLAKNSTAVNKTGTFSFQVATRFRSLVVNEIFADPSGSSPPSPVVLPTSSSGEFIELFNAGTRTINIEDFDLSGGTIGAFVLAPNAYVTLTSTSNVATFTSFGDVIGVTSWNGLSNAGEKITLKDNLGNIVDTLTYNLDWYHDTDKDDGAWTIEQINPSLSCGAYIGNWSASADTKGGTPSAQNSILNNSADVTGPNVVSMTALDNNTFRFTFNEPMDATSLSAGTYNLDNGLTQTSISTVLGLLSVDVDVSTTLVSGTTYQATITGVKDCSGNAIATNVITINYDILPPTISRVIVKSLTEIKVLFDESLTESIAEKETNYSVNNSIGNPSSAILNNNQNVDLKFSTTLTPDLSNTLTVTNLSDLKNNAITGNLDFNFTYTQDIDTTKTLGVNLLDVTFNKEVEETIAETLTNYFVSGGAGNPILATLDGTNKKLVHLVFNVDFDENDDLTLTVENQKSTLDAFLSTPEYAFTFDTKAPELSLLTVQDSKKILLTFNELLEQNSANTANNYVYNSIFPSTAELQTDKKSVLLTFSSDFNQEEEFTLEISGLRDTFSNTLSKAIEQIFVYDIFPPKVDSLIVASPTSITLIFNEDVEKVSAETLTNYTLDNALENPATASQNLEFKNKVALGFASTIPTVQGLKLTVNNVIDSRNNPIVTEQQVTFDYSKLSLGNLLIVSDKALKITFSKAPNSTLAADVNNYEVNGLAISQVVVDGSNDKIYDLTLAKSITDNFKDTLRISNITDLSSNALDKSEYPFEFKSQFKQYELISNNTIELEFNVNLNATAAVVVTNYSVSPTIGNPAVATLDKNKVRLVFANDFGLNTDYTLTWSNISNEFENNLPNFSFAFKIDNTAPVASQAKTVINNLLSITFDEGLKETTAENESLYFVDNSIGNPKIVTYNASDSTVKLEFSKTFSESITYKINLDRIEDLSNNQMNNQQLSFTYTAPLMPAVNELLITEIMANPSPIVGLPEKEYVEIYNNSSKTFNLSVVNFSDNSNTVNLGNVDISPNQYLILTSDASSFTSFGSVLDVNSFPALTNSGETISLTNTNGVLLDKVSFKTSFYRDAVKDDGGYALERIYFAEQCIQELNWITSTDSKGGTPGIQNSMFNVNLDNIAPKVTEVKLVGTNGITIHFDEVLDSLSLKNGTYAFTNGLTVQDIIASNSGVDSVQINFTTDIEAGIIYTVTVSNVSDCSSNALVEVTNDFGIGKIPIYGDLLITEIMTDPSPIVGLPEEEFIEIYNNSTSLINLEGIKLADASDTTTFASYNLLPNSYLILSSTGNTSDFSPFGNNLGVSSFPSLGNTVDSLYLFLANNTLIDRLFYASSFYRDASKDDGGYALERIYFAEQCAQSLNWIASTDAKGGTPGTQNSVFNGIIDSEIPEVVSFTTIKNQSITVLFNEPMDSLSLVEGTYTITGDITLDKLDGITKGGNELNLNYNTEFDNGVVYNLSLSNVKDCSGNIVNPTSFEFGFGDKPKFNELIITEIMSDPDGDAGSSVSLPSVEYLELYNPTNKNLELSGLTLQDETSQTTLKSYLLLSKQYLLLVPKGNEELYPNTPTLSVSSWPSLNNGGETIAIFNQNNLVFSLAYSNDWYKDSDKTGGGYSLEMIDIGNPCGDFSNWTASVDARGGTPGLVNSVATENPDNFGPQLIDAVVKNTKEVVLHFDEKLSPLNLPSGIISLEPNISIIGFDNDSLEIKQVTALLGDDLAINQSYTITADEFTDCLGNAIRTDNKSAAFLLPEAAINLDIIINEVLFNPLSGGVDFVEIYNNSSKAINLKKWQVSSVNGDNELVPKTITNTDVVINPSEYKVLTTDFTKVKSNYPAADESAFVLVASLSAMPNGEGTVIILDSLETQIDRFDYNEDYHFNLLDNVKGVSLERISFDAETNNANTWQSAASTAGFATPGLVNSQQKPATQSTGTLTVEPKVFVPDNTGVNNFTTINYDLKSAGSFANIKIFNHRGQLIKTIAQGDLLSTNGFFTWDGTNDAGSKASFGYYVIYFEIYDSSGNTEVMKETIVLGTRF